MLILIKIKTAMLAGALAAPTWRPCSRPLLRTSRMARCGWRPLPSATGPQAIFTERSTGRRTAARTAPSHRSLHHETAGHGRRIHALCRRRRLPPRGRSGRRTGCTRRRRQLARCLCLRRMGVAQDRYHPSSADRRGVDIRSRREGARRNDAARRPLRSGAGLDRPLRSRIRPLQAGRDGRSVWRHVRHQQQRTGRPGRQCLGVDE